MSHKKYDIVKLEIKRKQEYFILFFLLLLSHQPHRPIGPVRFCITKNKLVVKCQMRKT
nr:MAG TPA: hypothetical protein [Caudoviricetes sp.]